MNKNNIIISVYGNYEDELWYMGYSINNEIPNVKGIEYNISCPNISYSKYDIVKCVQSLKYGSKCNIPIGIKLGYEHGKDLSFLKEIENDIEWININSVPWHYVYPNKVSPFAKYGGGGISGKLAQFYNWEFAELLSKTTKIPIIIPSIMDYSDMEYIKNYKNINEKAYAFGSIFMNTPWRPNAIIREINKDLSY